MNPAICPICGHTLKPGESLLARFIPAHNWWVVHHMPAEMDETKTGHVFDTYKNICGQAGYVMSPTPDGLFKNRK